MWNLSLSLCLSFSTVLSLDVHTGFDEYTLKKECAARTYRGGVWRMYILYAQHIYIILCYIIMSKANRIPQTRFGSLFDFFFQITSGGITRARFYKVYIYTCTYLRIACDNNILCISVVGFLSADRLISYWYRCRI